MEKDLEIYFIQQIFDAMMKRALVGFLCILGMKYMIGSVFFFSRGFKTQTFSTFCAFIYYLITTFFSFVVSVIFKFNNAYLIQYHFNRIPFTYSGNIAGCFINRNKKKLFWSASRQLKTLFCFRIELDLDGLILDLSFEFFCQPLLKWQTSKVLKAPQISFYQTTIFL